MSFTESEHTALQTIAQRQRVPVSKLLAQIARSHLGLEHADRPAHPEAPTAAEPDLPSVAGAGTRWLPPVAKSALAQWARSRAAAVQARSTAVAADPRQSHGGSVGSMMVVPRVSRGGFVGLAHSLSRCPRRDFSPGMPNTPSRRLWPTTRVVVVLGARQVGKSTLLEQVAVAEGAGREV